MLKITLYTGIPGSGKSTDAKAELAKNPNNLVRINNDDIRAMINGSVFSKSMEKIVSNTRSFLIREALKHEKSIIIDNLNLNPDHFEECCAIAKSMNKDIVVTEKIFYVPLDVAIERDSKRSGAAQVGADVIKHWWKKSGKEQLQFRKPKIEIFSNKTTTEINSVESVKYIDGLEEAIIVDLDGTLALINGRNPYDATDCDKKDRPNLPVIETVLAHHKAGRKVIFCSGRQDKYKPETIRFIEKHVCVTQPYGGYDKDFVPHTIPYKLFMRATDDYRKDSIVKEEMYNKNIKGKYNVLLVLDDRESVVELWRSLGLTCFQVAPGKF